METQSVQPEEEGGMVAEIAELSEESRAGLARNPKASRCIKMQSFILLKDIVSLDEIRLKFMRQGQDISRGRLLSEAIRLLVKEVSTGKLEIKG